MNSLDRLPGKSRIASFALGEAINFEFDGKSYVGLKGDTLAAALLANGVRVVGRSFKLHRPRGVVGWGVEEPNALMQLEAGGLDQPNARATLVPLYEGMRVRGQNAWPSVQLDLLGSLDVFHRLLPASFYYKSMMWPNWAFYERFVRPIAGLGKAPTVPDAQTYQKENVYCDVLICGGGPAGLAAALAAGQSGANVVLVDDKEDFGGTLLSESRPVGEQRAMDWVRTTVDKLSCLPNVRLLTRTTVSGYYENNFLAASQRVVGSDGSAQARGALRERLLRIHAKRVVLATGALERPLVFTNNDRPGVMLASAVRFYANRFGVVPGRAIVVVTNNDSAYQMVLDLADLGIQQLTVVDTRRSVPPALAAAAAAKGIRLFSGYAVHDVHGRKSVHHVSIAEHLGDGRLGTKRTRLACDLLAVSGGWTPTVHLYSQAGGALVYDKDQACLVPNGCTQAVDIVGSANGDFAFNACVDSGYEAGSAAARELGGKPVHGLDSSHRMEEHAFSIEPFWYTTNRPSDKQWLDFQYDVKVADVELAMRENFVSVEHVKRYTTGGMSVDQGKSSNFNILAVMAKISKRSIDAVGTTKFRPPFQPITLGAFAGSSIGERYAPWQELPAQSFHQTHHAHFGDYGWRRPEYYPLAGEDIVAATVREVLAVRNGVGMFDGSPLGKIEVKGPDAAVFLNRMYVNNMQSLKPGFARYGMLANENGVLIDDGVIVRLAPDHYLVHATSAAVNRVALLFEEFLQCEWPELRVLISNVTTQWGNLTLSGPKARAVMQSLECDIAFDAEAFKHMEYREGHLFGVPVRVLRASFTGEITYEISIPVRYTLALWERIYAAGAPFGIVPYGIEALEVMRTEKGYLHIGGDTDGTTNPLDIGWGGVIEKKVGDFIGRRSLSRPADRSTDRLQFVGLEPVARHEKLPVGGHVISKAEPTLPMSSEGYVTSAITSPILDKVVGLGLVQAGQTRLGEQVFVYSDGAVVAARIVPPTHFDPKGERLHA